MDLTGLIQESLENQIKELKKQIVSIKQIDFSTAQMTEVKAK